MKPVSKFAATVAMAFSIGVLPQANAQMELKSGGVGDALLFPIFDGRVDNYFTISNNSGEWLQAHIRFRNALTCTEVLDFDMIFSPGDVFVFGIHPDGDTWVIDKSLDPHNFEYMGLGNKELKPNSLLLLSEGVTPAESDHANWSGYIEVIAEGVFDGKGTSNSGLQPKLWSWVGAQNAPAFNGVQTASDVPNVLSGTAMIGIPGLGMGIAYNAEAIVNFRTTDAAHRINNYPHDNGVILHSNTADDIRHGPSPVGDYVFGFREGSVHSQFVEDRPDELALSFTTTWGPTLLDGDDNSFVNDQWDAAFSVQNSLFEVMNAIHETGQIFSSFYFDLGNTTNSSVNSMSLFFAFFPTKFAIGQDSNWRGQTNFENYVKLASKANMGIGKSIVYEVWNTDEVWGSCTENVDPSSLISPSYPGTYNKCGSLVLGQCVTRFGMDFLKDTFRDGASQDFRNGRVVIACDKANGACDLNADNAVGETLPFKIYTFDFDGDIGRWRSMSPR